MQAGLGMAHNQINTFPQSNVWSTRMTQCGPPGEDSDWCISFVCCPCAAAVAKGRADRTNSIYNFFCWNPIGAYSYVRHEYGIVQPCGDDCGYGIFCAPCTIRQLYTESRLRGVSGRPGGQYYGQNLGHWEKSLFDCTCCGFFKALLCPCCAAADVREVLQPSSQGDDCFNAFCLNPAGMYGQVRNHYGILADCPLAEDMCVPLFCFPCALNRARVEAQGRREQMAQMLPHNPQGLAQMVFGNGNR